MGLDSVELVLAIEEDFQIEISNEVTARVLSVRHMRDLIVDELRRVGREANPDAVFSRLRGISSSNWRSSHPRSYSTLSSCATFASIERYKLILTPLCKLWVEPYRGPLGKLTGISVTDVTCNGPSLGLPVPGASKRLPAGRAASICRGPIERPSVRKRPLTGIPDAGPAWRGRAAGAPRQPVAASVAASENKRRTIE